VIALDLSRSMDATDRVPSRLARARYKVIDLLRAGGATQTGLVAYAGDAYTVSPLSDDHATIEALVPSLDSSLMPQPGTRTDLALERAGMLLRQAGVRHGDVILVTDAVNPIGPSLSAAQGLRAAGYRLSILAIGTRQGAPISLPGGGFVSDDSGAVVLPQLNTDALGQLAAAGGGRLVIAGDDPQDIAALPTSHPTPASAANDPASDHPSGHPADRWQDQGPWLLLLLLPLAALGLRRGWLGILAPCILLPLMMMTPTGQAIAAAAFVDRQELLLDETLYLTVRVPGHYRGDPDFSAIDRGFEILSVNHSSRINRPHGDGELETQTEWLLILSPRQPGALTIPSIEVGGELTPPVSIQVRDPKAAGVAGDIIVELSAEPDAPYVQAQTLLTLRIFHAVALVDPKVAEPQARDAGGDLPLHRLGEDRAYRSERNGRPYRVIERRWALFPQQAGELNIAAIGFRSQVRFNGERGRGSNNGQNQAFGRYLDQTREVHERSQPLQLMVRPRPTDIPSADWLPAQALRIEEDWQPAPPVFRVGEPVIRRLTLIGYGVRAVQLPDLELETPAGLRIYADQPLSKDRVEGASWVGRRSIEAALLPVRPGKTRLPGFTIPWWDTDQHRQRIIRVPERVIDILPTTTTQADAQQASPSKQPQQEHPKPQPSAASPTADSVTLPLPHIDPLSSVLAIAWLLTLLLWLRQRRLTRQTPGPAGPPPQAPAGLEAVQVRSLLSRGCRDHDARVCRDALLAWGALAWPDAPPQSLPTIAQRLPPDPDGPNGPSDTTRQALLTLDRALYRDPGHWRCGADRDVLKRLVRQSPEQASPNATVSPLPNLYPPSRPTS
jgi:hypothetical protein